MQSRKIFVSLHHILYKQNIFKLFKNYYLLTKINKYDKKI